MTPDHYPAPRTWAEVIRLKRQVQVDLLAKAAREHATVRDAADSLGMTDTHFRTACQRLGVQAKKRGSHDPA